MSEYYKNYNKKKLFCCNCGKYGHKYSKCNDPITSLGIIAVKINDIEIFSQFINFFDNGNYFNLVKSNSINNNILLQINKFKDKFKFLMIQRKKTLGYIEYIRGRYDETAINTYTLLFEQMTPSEVNDIKNKNFIDLWNDLWQKNADNKFYKSEFEEAEKKHTILKSSSNFNNFINNIKLNFDIPEWGFPKGRRVYLEKNLNCACREFEEETSLKSDQYQIINNIPYIQETFYGTDNILYKHIYYFAMCKPDIEVKIDKNNLNQIEEIGDIGWFSFNECSNLIRPYHYERQKLLNETFLFLSSILRNKFDLSLSIVSEKLSDNKNDNDNNDNDMSDDESTHIVDDNMFICDDI
jgi:8-oxo-dGTP pyrophosphatase MutT (NUDIX family)